jgi:phospholipid transport system substrate-binding protein
MFRKKTQIAIILIVFLVPVQTFADSAMETVKNQVNDLLTVLRSQADDAEKEASIRRIAGRFFDFTTLSRFTLGRNWRRLDPEQKKTFTNLYRKLLENVYMGKLLQYTDQRVVYDRDLPLTDTRTEIQTRLISDSTEIPITYKMTNTGESWKVYDLVIENVSLVQNYRSQFTSILRDKSPEEMLETLRKKVQSTG